MKVTKLHPGLLQVVDTDGQVLGTIETYDDYVARNGPRLIGIFKSQRTAVGALVSAARQTSAPKAFPFGSMVL
ncbi:MAG: hypothetical protein QM639_10640 [Rhodocyclaceae bacterium]